jgi:RND family efflux transporter MFP subunit
MKVALLVSSGALLTAGALAGCSSSRAAEADAAASTGAVAVRVQPAQTITAPRAATTSGIVDANTAVDVAFQVPGKVAVVGPDEGDVVRAGQTLAELDPTDYRLGLEQADAQAEHAAQERDRYRPLLAAGSIAPNDMERIESGARQTAAAAGIARKRLADTRLVSPLGGVVARRAIEVGETAAPGQLVFTIIDLDPVRVRVGVPEGEIGTIRVGQPATVRIPALGAESFTGRVSLVGVAADPTTRTYAVEVAVPNPSRRLKAGMVAEATLAGDGVRTATTVPAAAVIRGAGGQNIVYLVDAASQRVRARPVVVGSVHGTEIEIASGIAAGDVVVVAGQHRLRDGSQIVVESPAPAKAAVGGAQ